MEPVMSPENNSEINFDPDHLRMLEAIIFASPQPLGEGELAQRLPEGAALEILLGALAAKYETAGVNLVKRGPKWLFQTAPDLAFLLRKDVEETKRLGRAAVETLAIVAYHQQDRKGRMKGVSRAEIEDVRGVSLSRGTLDVLIEAGWVKPIGRRQVPGRPIVYGTTQDFLAHFGLESVRDLPGIAELQAAGMLDPLDQSVAAAMSTLTAGDEDAGIDPLEDDDIAEELALPEPETASDQELPETASDQELPETASDQGEGAINT
jgi:segregation and condensation protein B